MKYFKLAVIAFVGVAFSQVADYLPCDLNLGLTAACSTADYSCSKSVGVKEVTADVFDDETMETVAMYRCMYCPAAYQNATEIRKTTPADAVTPGADP